MRRPPGERAGVRGILTVPAKFRAFQKVMEGADLGVLTKSVILTGFFYA